MVNNDLVNKIYPTANTKKINLNLLLHSIHINIHIHKLIHNQGCDCIANTFRRNYFKLACSMQGGQCKEE